MTNGKEIQSWWSEPLTQREWTEFFPLFVRSEVSLAQFFAGITSTDRPSRDRAAGCLAALANPTGGVSGSGLADEARALLARWAAASAKAVAKNQYPQEDRVQS